MPCFYLQVSHLIYFLSPDNILYSRYFLPCPSSLYYSYKNKPTHTHTHTRPWEPNSNAKLSDISLLHYDESTNCNYILFNPPDLLSSPLLRNGLDHHLNSNRDQVSENPKQSEYEVKVIHKKGTKGLIQNKALQIISRLF